MKLIRPTTITSAMLTASNVPETDQPAWSSATAYTSGTRCLYSHKIYYCLVAHTNAQPDANIAGVTPKWLDEGYDNRWRMIDQLVGSQTTQADSITLTVTPGLVDSIALMDLSADSIDIVITPTVGEIYTEHIDLINKTHVLNAYTYFFEPILLTDTVCLLGIPAYTNASIAITITKTGGTAAVGTLILGTQYDLGGTQYNPTIGITDYSTKTTDEFGNYTIVQRVFSKKMSCELYVENSAVDMLQRTLASYRTLPVVWIGADALFASMIIYGFYKSFSITIPAMSYSTCSIEIEGLS